jgi:protein-L-isoaspartate(D-aspartate) O-methyltransferase
VTSRGWIALLPLAAPLAAPAGCGSPDDGRGDRGGRSAGAAEAGDRAAERLEMVARERGRGISDPEVLAALGAVPRHRFVPAEVAADAYADRPLPIGYGQTISQPLVVALMTEAAEVEAGDRVLEIGTGSGYQAAVLAEIAGEVWTIEIVEPLAERARAALQAAGYDRVHVRAGDGYRGWPEEAPFDAILVTAAPDHVPQPLLDQLAPGGRLVLPLGGGEQIIVRLRRTAAGFEREELWPVRFVPMTGEAERGR